MQMYISILVQYFKVRGDLNQEPSWFLEQDGTAVYKEFSSLQRIYVRLLLINCLPNLQHLKFAMKLLRLQQNEIKSMQQVI